VGAQLPSAIWRQWPCQAVETALRTTHSQATSLDPIGCLRATQNHRSPPEPVTRERGCFKALALFKL